MDGGTEMTLDGYDELVLTATGHKSYGYQRRLALKGLPGLVQAPTGTGKTAAVVLAWLYRRRFHPDPAVRKETPRWLVYTLPARVLVEQVHDNVGGWLKNLGLAGEVGLHRVMGGDDHGHRWRDDAERDTVVVGTVDMLISRALNRGYGGTQWSWPVDFGLFNNGCHWIFDEVQLFGPALPTSLQLDGLRRLFGTALPCRSTWMSATVDPAELISVDHPEAVTAISPGDDDRNGPLSVRLGARKQVHQLQPKPQNYIPDLASALSSHHRAGTLTIAVVNTVDRAVLLHQKLIEGSADTVLVHSRFRPNDRAERLAAALAEVDPDGPGRIVVTTQVLEAGVDISAATLFTEAAPWSSVVQRAGRGNRDGLVVDASLLWCAPPKAAPYENPDVKASGEALVRLEGRQVTGAELAAVDVAVVPVVHPVLRRRDLLDLFDTTPDLTGDVVDVSRFIRAADDLDVDVAWRDTGPTGPGEHDPLPGPSERCPVPVPALRDALKNRLKGWRHDHQLEHWVPCRAEDVRPGMTVVLAADGGGYEPSIGWSPKSKQRVDPVPDPVGASAPDAGVGDDPASLNGLFSPLLDHLEAVEQSGRDLVAVMCPDLPCSQVEAVLAALRLHDIGKVHPEFQDMLRRCAANEAERALAESRPGPWAKGGSNWRVGNKRRHYRHELAGALVLLGEGSSALRDVGDPDLVVYLVAAHHGRVRLGFRPLTDERHPPGQPDRTVALGVWDGEELPPVTAPGGVVPASRLNLSVMDFGSVDGRPSWSQRSLALRDRPELGPFRLAFLETLVRLSDWRGSAKKETR